MAAALGTESTAVVIQPEILKRLRESPWAFDFFQAVRLLALLQPKRERVGRFSHPRLEIARFGVFPSLSFPASQIQSLTFNDTAAPKMIVNFIGLTGPLGLLPRYYTELVIGRTRSHDYAMRDFFDMFHHRIASLFYQAWEKHHFFVGYERDRKDPFFERLQDLVGVGTSGLHNRLTVRDETLVFYGGLFGMAARSASALEAIVGDYFDVPVEVEQFVGVWRALETPDQCCLDVSEDESGQLGFGAVVGDEIWDRQSRVRIKIGPLPAKRYLDFLPNGSAYEPLQALTKFFSGNDLEFEVQLSLCRDDVPGCELGAVGEGEPQLGWFTWMKSELNFDRDPSDTVLLLT